MKVLVNGTPLLAPLAGIGQYIRHLFTEMSSFEDIDLNLYYGLRCEKGLGQASANNGKPGFQMPSAQTASTVQTAYGILKKVLPQPREIKRFVEKVSFNYHANKLGAVIYHEPSFFPLPYDGPTVLTVHDLSCFDHPETHPRERVEITHRELPCAIERADHIIVISEATRDAVVRRFSVLPERITVTHLAADGRFMPRPAEALLPELAKVSLVPGAYVLCVGTLEPRKNLATLFAAYGELPAALRQRFPLVVAGMPGWHMQSLEKAAARLVDRGELLFLGYVPDALMPMLYAGAAAFAYPSIYEGFGLPPLEAMASGVPVITSNRTSLPEVIGNGGIMLDPADVDGFRRQLHALLDDPALASHWRARGLAQAAHFSWQRCASETVAVYRKLAEARGLAF